MHAATAMTTGFFVPLLVTTAAAAAAAAHPFGVPFKSVMLLLRVDVPKY